MVGYANQGVPTSAELENNSNQNKYTVNRSPKGGVTLSKFALFLITLGMLLLLALAVGLTILLYPSCSNAAPEALTASSQTPRVASRLPSSLIPTHYRLQIMPFLEPQNFTTSGVVTITLSANEETDKIALNSYDITVDEESVKVKPVNGDIYIAIASQEYDKISQIYTIHLKENLEEGKQYELEVKFVGKLSDKMQGFYRSSYIDPKTNTTRWMASTQFSPVDARRAFPCFDEPAFKAKFTISIARPHNMSTISNMPKRSTDTIVDKTNWQWDHYSETPAMPTYLVAFVVSDLQAYRYNNSEKLFTIWTTPNSNQKTALAINLSPKILQFFESYFGIKYPLPKIDLVAVPDFGFNGMENWGLITFREKTLLFDERTGTIEDKKFVILVLAHELAHQWFGNLVTPKWWDDLWLKEGFSDYVRYLGVRAVLPEWRIMQEFLLDETYEGFAVDCLNSSRPISFDVTSTESIRQSFDALSYYKGAAVVRMLDHILGEDKFRAGLIKYLNDHKYSNANRDDLWNALSSQLQSGNEAQLDASLKEIMDTWVRQAGFPVISATRNHSSGEVYVSQKRFFLTRGMSNDNTLWWVPISYTSDLSPRQDDTIPKVWLKNEFETSFSLEADRWWLLNVFQTGYFIVNYDESNWRNLLEHVYEFPSVARVQLISDSMTLARANLLDYDIPLRLLTNIGIRDNEFSFVVHSAALERVTYLYNMLISTPIYKKFEDFLFRIYERVFSKYDFNDKTTDDYNVQRLRRLVVKWACRKSGSECTNNARVLFRKWIEYPNQAIIPPNVKEVVFCTAIREGGETEWNLAYKQLMTSNSINEKMIILDALGCSQIPWILNRYLDLILQNNTDIRKQDSPRIFKAVVNNPVGYTIAFNYLRSHWDSLVEHYGPAFNTLSRIVADLSTYMNSPYQLVELQNFKKDHNLDTAAQALDRVIETVKVNIEWMEHSYESIEKWLNDHINHYGLKK